MMGKKDEGSKRHRITISLDTVICEKIKQLQDQMSKKSKRGYSFSKTINILLLGGILGNEKLLIRDWNIIKDYSDGKEISLEDLLLDDYIDNLIALRQWI